MNAAGAVNDDAGRVRRYGRKQASRKAPTRHSRVIPENAAGRAGVVDKKSTGERPSMKAPTRHSEIIPEK